VTLVETTVAIALLAVIVVAILSAFSAAAVATGRHQQQAKLDVLVRSDAEFIKSQAYDPNPAAYSDIAASGYTFSTQVLYYDPLTNSFSAGNPESGLEEIFVTVTAQGGGSESLYFLKVDPT
jgi:type II secretory pathway pseudopilin PulG